VSVDEDLRAAIALAPSAPAGGLADFLYERWYLRIAAPEAPGEPLPLELDVVAALRAAHAGSERFDRGWRARRVSTHGRAEAVHDDGRARVLERADYLVPRRPGRRAEPGDALAVVAREEAIDAGFWITFLGDWPRAAEGLLARLYWRVPAAGAPALVRALTGAVMDAGAAGALKAPLAAAGFARADAVVLYLAPDTARSLAGELSAVARSALLRDPPPRLTRRLGVGVGVAEGWAARESFGQSRCRLVAEGIAAGGEPLAAIRARFAAAGLDPDRPYLEPGSTDGYGW
jgi:hypothetical protein